VDDQMQRRLARNEVLFRDTNEAIVRGHFPDEPGKLVRFRCECSRLECGEAVPLTLAEYEQVRRSPKRFVLVPGHELPELETLISRGDRYAVVEKRDVAGATAVAEDPRAPDAV
jgi:hypothetical protein